MVRYISWLAAGVLLATLACGSEPQLARQTSSVQPVASIEPPSPTPPFDPKTTELNVSASWEQTTNALGDVTEKLAVQISTNIPVSFYAYPYVYLGSRNISGVAFNVTIEPNQDRLWRLTFSGRAPAGDYIVEIDVPSYNSGYTGQLDDYVALVGGPQGPRLVGNPLAVHDPDHPAVLNLQRRIAVHHT